MNVIAVVGCGYWGPNLIRNFFQIDDCRIKYVCDVDPARLGSSLKKHPGLSAVTDFETVLADPEVEAVVLATPIQTHFDLAKRALERDKHVLVEKPLADNVDHAAALTALAEKRGLVLMVDHTFLFSPPVLRIKEMLASGEIGRLHFINMMRVNFGFHRSGSNVVWDLGAHDVSILLDWLGETPASVQAFGRDCVEPGVYDVSYMNLVFPSGVIANVNISWLSPSKYRNILIVGSKEMVVFDDTKTEEKIKVFHQGVEFREPSGFGEFQLTYRTGDIVSPPLAATEPLFSMASHFIECIRESRRPRSDGRSGVDVVRTLDAAIRSLRNNCRPEALEASVR